MFEEHFVCHIDSEQYFGPFMTFQAAFNHIARHKKDARIEKADGTVLATWSLWTGLYKVNAQYKQLVVDCDFNRINFPDLVGQVFDRAPTGPMVRDVEVAA